MNNRLIEVTDARGGGGVGSLLTIRTSMLNERERFDFDWLFLKYMVSKFLVVASYVILCMCLSGLVYDFKSLR